MKALADDHPGWTLTGVDPSADMLLLAEQSVGPHAPRIRLHEGYIDSAPAGPFDGAVCLLTLHFVP
ncbi:class I SAM-dependent methyltransferase, partial [Acinetobacter baumannii]